MDWDVKELFLSPALPLKPRQAMLKFACFPQSVRADSFEGAGCVMVCGIYLTGAVLVELRQFDVWQQVEHPSVVGDFMPQVDRLIPRSSALVDHRQREKRLLPVAFGHLELDGRFEAFRSLLERFAPCEVTPQAVEVEAQSQVRVSSPGLTGFSSGVSRTGTGGVGPSPSTATSLINNYINQDEQLNLDPNHTGESL